MSHSTPEHSGYRDTISGDQEEAYHQEGVIKQGPTVDDVKREIAEIINPTTTGDAVFTKAERCPRCKGTGFIGKAVDVEGKTIPYSERCEVCNSELRQCGVQGVDGEPSRDCLVCKLREQLAAEREAREIAERSAKAWEEDAHRYATNLDAEREKRTKLWEAMDKVQEQLVAAVEALKEVRKLIAIHGNVHPALTIIDAALSKIGVK